MSAMSTNVQKNIKCPQMSINLHKFARSRKMSKFPQVQCINQMSINVQKCPQKSKNDNGRPQIF
jgi:hypothetical protein